MITHEAIATRLAFYYREPMFIDEKLMVENPRLIEMMKFFRSRFKTVEGVIRFEEKIKENFKATSTVPFPGRFELEMIYKLSAPPDVPSWNEYKRLNYEDDDRRGLIDSEKATGGGMGDVIQAYAEAHGTPIKVSDENVKSATSDVIFRKAQIDFPQALKVYGILPVYNAFKEFC